MNFLSTSNLEDFFNEFDHKALVTELNSVHDYLTSIIDEKVVHSLIAAINNSDFKKFIKAMQESNEVGHTFHSIIDFEDQYLHVSKAIELMELYEALEDHNYTSCEIDGIAFIEAEYFETYIKEQAIENGDVVEHMVDCVNWSDYAHKMKQQYGSVDMECPLLLGKTNLEFFYPK